jgi:glutaredoxin
LFPYFQKLQLLGGKSIIFQAVGNDSSRRNAKKEGDQTQFPQLFFDNHDQKS